MYDILCDIIDIDIIEKYLRNGVIEMVPLSYIRGRTFNNAFVVLDGSHNCTTEELRIFLSRFGANSKVVVTGDIKQNDHSDNNLLGLEETVKILSSIKGIKFFYLTNDDVVKHPLTQEIIEVYENFYREKRK